MTETVLGGILIAVVSGAVGKVLGARGSVKQPICDKMRDACQELIIEKLDNLNNSTCLKVDGLSRQIGTLQTTIENASAMMVRHVVEDRKH